jgi:hypothetical protein
VASGNTQANIFQEGGAGFKAAMMMTIIIIIIMNILML